MCRRLFCFFGVLLVFLSFQGFAWGTPNPTATPGPVITPQPTPMITSGPGNFIISITPNSGNYGTVVRIMGNKFTPTNNTIVFVPQGATDRRYQVTVPSNGSTILQMTVPEYLQPNCVYDNPGGNCIAVIYHITDGPHLIYVKNANGTSNSCVFRVMGSQIPPAPTPVPGAIKIGEADNGKTIQLVKGNIVELSLDTNPSTGYGWEFVQEPNSGILRLEDHYLAYKDPTNAGMPGAPMIEYWIYLAVGSGSTSISLEYLRSWETVPPIKTFMVNFIVN